MVLINTSAFHNIMFCVGVVNELLSSTYLLTMLDRVCFILWWEYKNCGTTYDVLTLLASKKF